jgi:hypothetical protein
MDAVRCVRCGETRWCLSSATFEHLLASPCEVCGGEMTVERRRPGTAPRRHFVERRNLGAFPTMPPSRLAGTGARSHGEGPG